MLVIKIALGIVLAFVIIEVAQLVFLLDLRLAKTISTAVLERKARAVANERERLRVRTQAVRDQRATALRAVEESASIRRLLDRLSAIAKREGNDPAHRAELVRLSTKGIVFHAHGRKVEMRYMFRAPIGVVSEASSGKSSGPWSNGDDVAGASNGASSP